MAKVDDVLKMLEGMTVLELSELIKSCEDKFGVKASAPVMAAQPAAGASPQEEEEVKTSFNIVLSAVGSNKIAVIKEIRTITELGLREAKALVDAAPKTVKENVSKEEAEEIKKKLEVAGASVELK